MKKLIALFFALVVCAASLAGCQSTPEIYNFDGVLPWTYRDLVRYERCDYTVVREYVEWDGKAYTKRETVAEGAFSLTVDGDDKTFLVNTALSITYNNSDYADKDGKNGGEYKGKTDVITSSATFTKSLLPIKSEKTAGLQTAPDKSYKIDADYVGNKSEFTMPLKDGQIKTLNGVSQQQGVYDNETLYYVVRAYAGLKEGASIGFNTVNLFDCHVSARFFNYGVNIAVDGGLITVEDLPVELKEFDLKEAADGTHTKINCYKVTLSLTQTERGPAATLYYAAKDNDFGNSDDKRKKVLIKMETTEYDPYAGRETYKTTYVLSGYSMRPPAAA